jgi:hypothetical protein
MSFKSISLISIAIILLGGGVFLLKEEKTSRYFPKNLDDQPNLAAAYAHYIQEIKANRQTGEVSLEEVNAAHKQADKLGRSKALNIGWQFKGPDNVGGRTRATIVDRNNPNHLIAGGVSGGLYESFDAAVSWKPYDPNFAVTQISSITQDAAGDFYIGTGGHFEQASPDSVNLNRKNRGYYFIGSGIYKLTGNGGFELIQAPKGNSVNSDYATIGEITADPNIPGKLYVAMNNGYRELTISNGVVTEAAPITSSAKCLDVKVNPQGKKVVTFQPLTPGAPARVFTSNGNGGFKASLFQGASRIEADIAPTDSSIIYLSAAKSGSNCTYGFYRSQDGGRNWDLIGAGGSNLFEPFTAGFQCQGYWDNFIKVVPDNPRKIFVGGVTLWTWEQSSIDPAKSNGSWRQLDVLANRYDLGFIPFNYVHADKHGMDFHPTNSDIAYIWSDGGVTKSINVNDQAPAFNASNFNYGVTQYYRIGINGNDLVMGGTQDNGTHVVGLRYNNNRGGLQVLGGDGFSSELSVINPSIGVATLYFNRIVRIQGIGTSLGNTNISQADITSNNQFLGGLCVRGISGCSPQIFQTVTDFWESFNHEGSTDSVTLQLERYDLPPIDENEVINYESNNNQIFQQVIAGCNMQSYKQNCSPQLINRLDSLGKIKDANGNFMYPDTLCQRCKGDVMPFDTAIADIETRRVLFSNLNRFTLVVNYDTLLIDTSQQQILVNKFEGGSMILTYQLGKEVKYENVFGKTQNEMSSVTITDRSVTYKDMDIFFRYRIKIKDYVQSMLAVANWPGISGSGVNDGERNIFMTRDLLKTQSDIRWYNIAGSRSTPDRITTDALTMKFSPDGNYLFVGTTDGKVYRISDLNNINSNPQISPPSLSPANLYAIQQNELQGKCELIANFTPGGVQTIGDRSVTDIYVYPKDPNKVVVALGNYGNNYYIARSNNALAPKGTVQFQSIQGTGNDALPKVPSYTVLIDKDDSNKVLIGTDIGVFITENAFDSDNQNVKWTEENANLGRIPVFDLEQMIFGYEEIPTQTAWADSLRAIEARGDVVYLNGVRVTDQNTVDSVKQVYLNRTVPIKNEGKVYIGTHARGIFEMDQLVSVPENQLVERKEEFPSSFKLYPNPSRQFVFYDFDIPVKGKVEVDVYSLSGQKVYTTSTVAPAGENKLKFDVSQWAEGTYIVTSRYGTERFTGKLIVNH